MIGRSTKASKPAPGNATLALQKAVEERMRKTGRWVWREVAEQILGEDADLRERFHAETKRGPTTPR